MKKKTMKNLEIDCYVRNETAAAYYVETGVGIRVWIPKKLTRVKKGRGSMNQCDLLIIPLWLALDRRVVKAPK